MASAAAQQIPAWALAWRESRDDPYRFVTEVLDVLPYGAPNPNDEPQLEFWHETALRSLTEGIASFRAWQASGSKDPETEPMEGRRKRRLSVKAGHGVGKTAFMAWVPLWGMLTHQDIKIPIAASSQDQLRDTVWPEIKKWAARLPEPLQEQIDVQGEKVVVKADPAAAFAVRRTCSAQNPEALQGFHATYLVFEIDEASGIEDIVFEVARGALSTPGAIVILCGNPTRTSGFFHRTHTTMSHMWTCITVSSEDVPRARGHVKEIEEEYGRDSNVFRVRVLGLFPTADAEKVIPRDLVLSAVGREVAALDFRPVWGLDVGIKNDPCALAKRRANTLMEPPKEWKQSHHKGDTMVVVSLVMAELEATPIADWPSHIVIDCIGIGAGVADRLAELLRGEDVQIVRLNVGEQASADARFVRLRDEMWWNGRVWFADRGVRLPEGCDKLIDELTEPTFEVTAANKTLVESKKLLAMRGVKSPNQADAFLATLTVRDSRRVAEMHRKRLERRSARGNRSAWAA